MPAPPGVLLTDASPIMDRRSFLSTLALAAGGAMVLPGCQNSASQPSMRAAASDSTRYVAPLDDSTLRVHASVLDSVSRIDTPASAWKSRLSTEAYQVLFEEDTERPFSSPLLKEKDRGTFICKACHLPLFPSTTKYESGTGWPSFFAPLVGRLGTKRDTKLSVPRVEYHCKRCGGHHGHVFKDGPNPTGLRYCNNGVALRFIPENESLPELRA